MVLNVRSLDVECRKKHFSELISCLLYTRSCSWLSCVSVMETSDSQTFHYFLKKVFLTFNTVVCRMHSAFSVRLIFALVSYQQTTEQLLPSSSDFRFYPPGISQNPIQRRTLRSIITTSLAVLFHNEL